MGDQYFPLFTNNLCNRYKDLQKFTSHFIYYFISSSFKRIHENDLNSQWLQNHFNSFFNSKSEEEEEDEDEDEDEGLKKYHQSEKIL